MRSQTAEQEDEATPQMVAHRRVQRRGNARLESPLPGNMSYLYPGDQCDAALMSKGGGGEGRGGGGFFSTEFVSVAGGGAESQCAMMPTTPAAIASEGNSHEDSPMDVTP